MLRTWSAFPAVALLLLSAVRSAPGQQLPSNWELGRHLHVYVLTFGPGDDPWEKFGHNAIRIIDDAETGSYHDIAYNWGYFDFNGKNFFWNFLQGRLMYAMYGELGPPTINYYREKLHRDVRQQELNLSAVQKAQLNRLLVRQDTDENRFYRYDYYKDNCSSRVRDVIDNLIDHRLAAKTKGVFPAEGATLRFHTDRLTVGSWWLYIALQGAMGHPIDQPIDLWQEMFLPEKLHDRLNDVTVYLDGQEVPLVKADLVLNESHRPPELAKPPMMAPWLFGAGALIGGLFILLAQWSRRHWTGRLGWVLLTTPWLIVMIVGSAFMWWAWLATDHLVTRYNENVMQVNLLSFALIVLLPMAAFGKKRAAQLAWKLSAVVLAISILGLLLKATPWFYQRNYPIIALCLPVNAAIALGAWMMAHKPLQTPAPKLVAAGTRTKA